jgi:hypothetical protein
VHFLDCLGQDFGRLLLEHNTHGARSHGLLLYLRIAIRGDQQQTRFLGGTEQLGNNLCVLRAIQVQLEQDDVWLLLCRHCKSAGNATCLAHYLQPRLTVNQHAESSSDEGVVVHQHNANWLSVGGNHVVCVPVLF